MKCSRCQHENEGGAKFCEECAAPLARVCGNCGHQLSATAKFCPECAHPTGSAPAVPRFTSPESYTPKHLAERILNSKAALEGGEFDAFKLVATGTIRGVSGINSQIAGETKTTYWYAPAARAIIKSVSYNPYLGISTVELVEFQLRP